jgi:hypothetical protein
MKINQTIPVDGISNTKQAATFCTLGLALAQPGMFVVFDKDHPRSTGGTAKFLFESNLANTVQRYVKIYEDGLADLDLDNFLEELKVDLSPEKHADLEKHITEALLVYGRKILANYSTLVAFLRSDVNKFVLTGGDPVYSEGKVVGLQNFQMKGCK